MFEFYTNNTFEGQNSLNWIPIIIQLCTFAVAAYAVYTARESLNGVSRTQSVQSHMNLIALENEVRKNIANRAIATYENSKAKEDDIELLGIKENNAFILYFISVDKLASLVKTDYLKEQFKNRDWKNEYYDIFDDARISASNYIAISSGKSQKMIQNITILLDIWDEENINNLTENSSNTTIINS